MTNTLWSKWGYEDKDLSDIPNAVGGYRCPNCGRLYNMESLYNVNGIEYPQYYNEYLGMRYIAVLNVRLYFNSEAVVFKLINLVYENEYK